MPIPLQNPSKKLGTFKKCFKTKEIERHNNPIGRKNLNAVEFFIKTISK